MKKYIHPHEEQTHVVLLHRYRLTSLICTQNQKRSTVGIGFSTKEIQNKIKL